MKNSSKSGTTDRDINWDNYEEICHLGPEEFLPGIDKMWRMKEHTEWRYSTIGYLVRHPVTGKPREQDLDLFDDVADLDPKEFLPGIAARWNSPEHAEWKAGFLRYMMRHPAYYPTYRETLTPKFNTPPYFEKQSNEEPAPAAQHETELLGWTWNQQNAQRNGVQGESKFLGLIRKLKPKAKQTTEAEGQQASAQPKGRPKNQLFRFRKAHDPTREK